LPSGGEPIDLGRAQRITWKPFMQVDPIHDVPHLGNRPLYSFLVQFPAVCFTGALLTDLVYAQAPQFLWETFSIWLLAAGCLFAGLAGIVGLVHFLRDRRLRLAPLAWPHALVSLLVVVLSVIKAFIHSRDGYTAVVPEGLALSALVVVLMIAVAWMGWHRPVRVLRQGATL
jgi:uncharacterized membrane protein